MRYARLLPAIGLSFFFATSVSAGESSLHSITVRTDPKVAPENAAAKVWFRVPANYDPRSRNLYRVLVFFGGRNCTGENEARGIAGFPGWADKNGIFIVAPGFRNDEYWHPEKWSGAALRNALAEIKKKYRIDDRNLLFYGYSAGAQASVLFPHWQPDRTRAWVSHANGVFPEPSRRMRDVPGLVTCGDADFARYAISRQFVEKNRLLGVNVLWKSYPNVAHDVSGPSARFAQDFLLYYHQRHVDDLSPGASRRLGKETAQYVGDDMEGRFWPANTLEAQRIVAEDRVEFPSRELADAWGTPGRIREEPVTTRRGR
jgi:hypothetical protein